MNIDRSVPTGLEMAKLSGDALVTNFMEDSGKNDSTFGVNYLPDVAVGQIEAESPSSGFNGARFYENSNLLVLNRQLHYMDTKTVVREGRLLVPLRYLAQSLNIKNEDITYNKGIITLKKDNAIVKLQVNLALLDKNGKIAELDVAPILDANNRVLVPLRKVAESLDGIVTFNNQEITVQVAQ